MTDFIKVATIENAIEAQIVQSIIDERQIPHRIQSYHDTAYDGLFQMQKGWGVIYAPPAKKQEIEDILASLRSGGEF